MGRHQVVSTVIVVALLGLALWTSIAPAEPLSTEGARLVSKTLIGVVMLILVAMARTIIGHNPRRQFGMFLGTLGGMAIGVAMAPPISGWIGLDISPLSALGGIFLGWLVAYQFIKHIPRGGASRPTPWRTW